MEDSSNRYWVGFDLGGTKMLGMVYTDRFKRLGKKRRRTRGHEGSDAGLRRIATTIRDALKDAKVDASQLGGIGVGCPGPLDLNKGVIFEAPNLGWNNVPIRRFLEDEFGCPVVIANDVDSGVYGEYCFGAGKSARCVIGVFPGTGIGGGCVYDGQIFRGKVSSCMEIGYLQVMPDGPRAGTGAPGTLEAVASRLAISAAAAQAAYRGQAPYLREQVGTTLEDIRSGILAKSVANGDTAVEDIITRAAECVGRAVGSLVNLLAPDVVVLGGGLVEAMPELYLPAVQSGAAETALPSMAKGFEIRVAELGDDAAVMGAAAWARHEFSGDTARRDAADKSAAAGISSQESADKKESGSGSAG